MRPTDLISSVLLLVAVSSASPWPTADPRPLDAVEMEIAPVLRREIETTQKFDLSFSGTQGNTATTETSSQATGSNRSGGKTSGVSDKPTGTDSSGGGTNTKTTFASTKTFDARLPAGGVEMITPGPFAGPQYYKIKDFVTFAWNYTSLSVTPQAIDVLASCSLNSQTYTIATNVSVTGPTQEVLWDTGEFQATATVQLLTETYTLIVHDAAQEVSATARAGFLGTFDQFTFGMYVPQKYTPMADWVCVTCNAAISTTERQTLGFMFGMATLTVLSFGWFGGVAGLW